MGMYNAFIISLTLPFITHFKAHKIFQLTVPPLHLSKDCPGKHRGNFRLKREKFLKTPTGFKLPKSLRLCLTQILNEFPNTENFVFHLFFVALLTCNILSSRSQKLYLQWGGCYKTDLTSMHLYFNVTKTGHARFKE